MIPADSISAFERLMTGAPLIVVLLAAGLAFLWRDVISERKQARDDAKARDARYEATAAASQAAMNNMANAMNAMAQAVRDLGNHR